ncbi:hypothetical protein [Demequina globuliformis]|uniref:hypothetical protein n=1 Tax=Demequina globuliformis TaxID=676202 RepID=UPI0007824251|nr:hypothetical protein [Demequina globuliformis]
MPSGGARNRSGPPADPRSGRSDARGLSFSPLPAEGYGGDVPEFPAPNPTARERHWWAWAWTTPQAAAWITPQESWRIPHVAEWCRVKSMLEDPDAKAALWAAKFRLDDKCMFSNAGLVEAGYRIVADEVAAKRTERTPEAPMAGYDPRAELRTVSDGR